MRNTRLVAAFGLLAVEAALAVLGVMVHYGFTAEYGDITASALEEFRWGFPAGIGGLALAIVGAVALLATVISPRRWLRAMALALPVVMVLGMFAVTPAALRHKLEVQYDATPQCGSSEDMGPGPGTDAQRESQEAFDSIEHVGWFGGGGGSGVGGCDRGFVLTEKVDVLQHYREALPEAGWRVVEEDTRRLRAERDDMAFEVVVCGDGGAVWAGRIDPGGGTGCDAHR
jgi:hypothetical protein